MRIQIDCRNCADNCENIFPKFFFYSEQKIKISSPDIRTQQVGLLKN